MVYFKQNVGNFGQVTAVPPVPLPTALLPSDVCHRYITRCYVMASGVQRNKYALPCAQHLVPMTISPTEKKYDIFEPWEHCHISLIMDFC